MERAEFDQLLTSCRELAERFPEGLVYIGGIAIYLHAVNTPAAKPYAEFTHDADFYISLADMSELRASEEVSQNRRLSKHQLIRHGFEFDIYTERQSSLIVPFDQIQAHADHYDDIIVACLEHLLALKLEAYRDRRQSAKGDKDARDIVRIALMAPRTSPDFEPERTALFLTDEHLELLRGLPRHPSISAMAQGNAHTAKSLRQSVTGLVNAIDAATGAATRNEGARTGDDPSP
jgi:hypothetical protein